MYIYKWDGPIITLVVFIYLVRRPQDKSLKKKTKTKETPTLHHLDLGVKINKY